ncbi:MAG: XRE family transcriptional regulator [Alphaproteobacteria bacterium]|nr:MAG: XRE family transcriptional regulator [Alphaproteobacteria bacterium]
MKFGDYIRQKREKNGWTQPEAAARANIEQSYLSKLETGKSYPSEDIFGRLIQIYDIDMDDLCRTVTPGELDTLREIRQVRDILLLRQRNEKRFMRGWLLAGLVMVMLGGGMLGIAASVQDPGRNLYTYRSEGVIREGEPLHVFDFMAAGVPMGDDESRSTAETLASRLDYKFIETVTNRGDSFVEREQDGIRVFQLVGREQRPDGMAISLHYGMGVMFLIGGIACFYIARRWR